MRTYFTIYRKVRPTAYYEGPEGNYRYSYTLSLTLAPDGEWVVNATPRPLYPPRRRPSVRCAGDWVELRAGLEGFRKSPCHRNSIPGRHVRVQNCYVISRDIK